MAELHVADKVWQELLEVARQRRKRPEDLADAALREFLQRQADETLLARSSAAARASGLNIGQTEAVIRRYRQRKAKA